MMTTRILPAAALVLGSLAVASVPASAAPLMVGAAAQPAPVTTQQVQWRHHHHGWHGGGGWHEIGRAHV